MGYADGVGDGKGEDERRRGERGEKKMKQSWPVCRRKKQLEVEIEKEKEKTKEETVSADVRDLRIS